jgi:molybdate transport system substrate-binding protein
VWHITSRITTMTRAISRNVARYLALLVVWLLVAAAAEADEIRVMTSGAFTAAHQALVVDFERTTLHTVTTIYGASMGTGETTIPRRLERGEPADIVILAASALDELIARGLVVAGSRVDLVRSTIGMAVRAGAPKPDISTVDALTRTLLRARAVAYSSSASGVYLSTELFARLGIADALKGRTMATEGAVGLLIASGEVEIGFQQISELLPVSGIEIVGPLPAEVQRVTVFSAGIVRGARSVAAARELLRFYASPQAAPIIIRTGLEPVAGFR